MVETERVLWIHLMINVLIVDDQAIVRQSLADLLMLEDDIEIVGQAGNGKEALAIIENNCPDVALMDLRMPEMDGVECTAQIAQRWPNLRVLVLTTFDDDEQIAGALEAGASGYLLKDSPSDEIASAIRAVKQGSMYLGPTVAVKVMSHVKRSRELEEMSRAVEELKAAANTDPLTQTLNRRGFDVALKLETERARISKKSIAAFLIDLDDFKQINEKHGHAGGDEVLKQLATCLRESMRESDHLSRIGGDEFVILLPDTDISEAIAIAQRCNLVLGSTPCHFGGEKIAFTASFGVVSIPPDLSELSELLVVARNSLMKSKKEGKNQVSWS